MKYIRTKDGKIVDVSLIQECETDDDNGKRIFDGYEDRDGTYYPVENIIKQADTIERLCDRFVVDFENGEEPAAFKNYLDALSYFGKAKIYGAIWTDKGLIYVAKTNDKVELELL